MSLIGWVFLVAIVIIGYRIENAMGHIAEIRKHVEKISGSVASCREELAACRNELAGRHGETEDIQDEHL